jgi:hypothetical protein
MRRPFKPTTVWNIKNSRHSKESKFRPECDGVSEHGHIWGTRSERRKKSGVGSQPGKAIADLKDVIHALSLNWVNMVSESH